MGRTLTLINPRTGPASWPVGLVPGNQLNLDMVLKKTKTQFLAAKSLSRTPGSSLQAPSFHAKFGHQPPASLVARTEGSYAKGPAIGCRSLAGTRWAWSDHLASQKLGLEAWSGLLERGLGRAEGGFNSGA